MPTLRLVPPVGVPIEINADRALVGRDPGADIVINDPSVSRRHALLEWRPEGWLVADQRSANGTWLDNQRVEQALIHPGQQIRFGAAVFQVVTPGAAARPPAPAYAPPGRPAAPPAPSGYAPQPPVPAYVAPAAAPAYPPAAPAAAPVYARPAAPPAPVPGGYAPPPPPPPPPSRPAPTTVQGGGMSEAEAAEILGLWPGTPPDEVRRRYQKLYNDFQIRLTNAPTPALKRMYQKNIQDLRIAAELLSPGAI